MNLMFPLLFYHKTNNEVMFGEFSLLYFAYLTFGNCLFYHVEVTFVLFQVVQIHYF